MSWLTNLTLSLGWQIKSDHLAKFESYADEMLKRKRVILISNNNQVEAILFFFITNNYEVLYKKSTWHTPIDEPEGLQLYIDKLICRKWNLSIRRKLREVMEESFPNINELYYHRAPTDRCVRIKRRGVCI